MADCDYCGESFDTKVPDSHLREQHLDELGPIDQRRLGETEKTDGLPTGPVALVGVVGVVAALAVYVIFFTGGGSASDIGAAGSDHYHGGMEVTVLNEEVDFSQQEYQLQDRRFHFEAGDGSEWHAHASGVSLGYAMEALGFAVTRDSFTYQATTYEDGAEYDVSVTVNGESVAPDYVLQQDDRVVVSVQEA
jgi:hypothetical protein